MTRSQGVRTVHISFWYYGVFITRNILKEFLSSKTADDGSITDFYMLFWLEFFNNRFLRERGMASTPKMEYQVFLCIFQKNSAMATLGLKKMGKFLWEGREKGLPCWLSQFSFAKLRQPTGQTFFPTFPKEFSHFLQTYA